ncbi:hypothetical protein ACLOJK_026659 [Asimina triloba]
MVFARVENGGGETVTCVLWKAVSPPTFYSLYPVRHIHALVMCGERVLNPIAKGEMERGNRIAGKERSIERDWVRIGDRARQRTGEIERRK